MTILFADVAVARTDAPAPHPGLDRLLRQAVALGLLLVLLLPLARGQSQWLGWAPLWLVGMPLSAWWALHRFRLPRWQGAATRLLGANARWRRRRPQATRRYGTGMRPLPRAA